MTRTTSLAAAAALLVLGIGAADLSLNQAAAAEQAASQRAPDRAQHAKPQRGKASYYGSEFNGRKMANGARFNPNSNTAASKTLPLGTEAKVTNLENGKTADVKVEDRGPYVGGRVVDVSPKVADQLDMKKEGTAPVVVQPVRVPAKDERAAAQ